MPVIIGYKLPRLGKTDRRYFHNSTLKTPRTVLRFGLMAPTVWRNRSPIRTKLNRAAARIGYRFARPFRLVLAGIPLLLIQFDLKLVNVWWFVLSAARIIIEVRALPNPTVAPALHVF